jgi:hypothetical protein
MKGRETNMRKVSALLGAALLTSVLALGIVACDDDEEDTDSNGETPAAEETEEP